jgi:hypothetical protein
MEDSNQRLVGSSLRKKLSSHFFPPDANGGGHHQASEEIRTLKSEAKNLRAQLAQLKRDDEYEQIKRNQKEATDREATVEQLLYVRRCILMIVDTIAVKLLHVDTTSHFAGYQSPGFLSGKVGFEKEVEAARYFVQKGYMVIMNDLTNCLRIGDLTMKRGDEVRTFEVKSNPEAYFTKEAMRQIITPIVLHDYVKSDVIKIPIQLKKNWE